VEPRPRSPLTWLEEQSLVAVDGRPTGEIPLPSAPQPAPRRHRRAAEPDDEDVPARAPAGRVSYDELLFGTSAPRPAGADTGSSSSESASYGSSSYEPPSYASPSAASPAEEIPSWSTGSTVWPAEPALEELSLPSSSAAVGSGSTPSTAEPAPRPEVPSSGHARLEQILAESGVQPPSGGRSGRRRYRDDDGESAGDDVLARVLGRG